MNTRHSNIIPECYADTLLVEMLGFKRPNHALNSNISSVLKTVRMNRPNQHVVGIIDGDRGKSAKLLDGFDLIIELNDIKKFIRERQTILVICPALEAWIFENAAQKDINPGNYGFNTRKSFEKACKRLDAKKNERLKNFLGLLKQKQAPGFTQLKTWICEGAGIDENDVS